MQYKITQVWHKSAFVLLALLALLLSGCEAAPEAPEAATLPEGAQLYGAIGFDDAGEVVYYSAAEYEAQLAALPPLPQAGEDAAAGTYLARGVTVKAQPEARGAAYLSALPQMTAQPCFRDEDARDVAEKQLALETRSTPEAQELDYALPKDGTVTLVFTPLYWLTANDSGAWAAAPAALGCGLLDGLFALYLS